MDFHRDCQSCACGNILFSRSSLFWFSTFNFFPEFSEQALGDDSALPETKTAMYNKGKNLVEKGTPSECVEWINPEVWNRTAFTSAIVCSLPHGKPWQLLPKWRCAWSWSRNKKSRRIVSSRQIASTSLNRGRSLARDAWDPQPWRPGNFLIICFICTPPRVPYASWMMVMRRQGGTTSAYFWNQRYPTIPFFSTRHAKRTLLTLRNVLACACISKTFAKPSYWQMHNIGGKTMSGRKPAASPGCSSHPPGWVRAKSRGVLRSTVGVEGCHANRIRLFHLTL